ncbi:HAMP domain-containing histidine kinase [Paenibacillus sp. ACRRX]|uniref:sensor histidine kinase n=1 Tax=Paenibacillus sp. ACRRX TaxID=2918206 RepID=UPI001EF57296|nr:HAMP domain-containing sensor histidine kinase [Paenibacillus sp. ACRRX]MCG7407884.1 HAMP domain-containing histidine kinase [Paenibacillus sp. ACRRX]
MNTTRRLAWHYVRQWTFVALVLIVCAVGLLFWIAERMSSLDMNRSFSRNGVDYITESLYKDSTGSLRWNGDMVDQVKASKGWMQLLDVNGRELYGFFTPDDVPKQYDAGALAAYMQRTVPFPYEIVVYIRMVGEDMYTIVYGSKPQAEELLARWQVEKEMMLPEMRKIHAWTQLLDKAGNELESWNKPASAGNEKRMNASDLALRSTYEERYREQFAYQYDELTGNTWVLRMPYDPAQAAVDVAGFRIEKESDLIIIGIIVFLIIMLLLFVLMASWQSTRNARPLSHFMRWAAQMAQGKYTEPVLSSGRSPAFRRSGKMKSNYRLYGDVRQAMEQLSQRLEASEDERTLHEVQRDQWLSGLSHDLKTPLASIIGYAHLLNAEQYNWTEEERKEFTRYIQQKAERMDALILDLNLTYQLQSQSLPLQLEAIDLNSWLRETLAGMLPIVDYPTAKLEFDPAPHPVYWSIDARYLTRAVENVCMNGWIHNPSGTTVKVKLEETCADVIISFHDDGKGMDDELQNHLFTRYYRGRTTDDSDNGSGLGMAITKQLVEAHGGSILVSSHIGSGTIIQFQFRK